MQNKRKMYLSEDGTEIDVDQDTLADGERIVKVKFKNPLSSDPNAATVYELVCRAQTPEGHDASFEDIDEVSARLLYQHHLVHPGDMNMELPAPDDAPASGDTKIIRANGRAYMVKKTTCSVEAYAGLPAVTIHFVGSSGKGVSTELGCRVATPEGQQEAFDAVNEAMCEYFYRMHEADPHNKFVEIPENAHDTQSHPLG